jgi:hypothetical protein
LFVVVLVALIAQKQNLNRAAVYEMLGPVWVLGENGKFDQVKAIVAAEEEKPVTSWEELLKLAMIYHQVQLEQTWVEGFQLKSGFVFLGRCLCTFWLMMLAFWRGEDFMPSIC